MAMRSLVGKLKALTSRMPRFGPPDLKDLPSDYKPVIDPTKYKSLKELNEALPALLDMQFKAEMEACEKYWKAYDRVTYVTAGAGANIGFAVWFFYPLLEDY